MAEVGRMWGDDTPNPLTLRQRALPDTGKQEA